MLPIESDDIGVPESPAWPVSLLYFPFQFGVFHFIIFGRKKGAHVPWILDSALLPSEAHPLW